MAYLDKVRKIPICGRQVDFAWLFGSMLELERAFGITRENFASKFKEAVEESRVLNFYAQLLYCGTRCDDNPPTMKEIERMEMSEAMEAQRLINEAMTVSATGGVPAGKNGAAAHGAAGASGGTGGPRSSRRSTAAGSRRKPSFA